MQMKRKVAVLYTLLIVLTILDIASTLVLLSLGGTEVNILTLYTWRAFGLEVSALIKIGLVVFMGAIIWLMQKVAKTEKDKKVAEYGATAILLLTTLWYIVVVVNNMYWIIYAGGV